MNLDAPACDVCSRYAIVVIDGVLYCTRCAPPWRGPDHKPLPQLATTLRDLR
jgi:hypothetical protein